MDCRAMPSARCSVATMDALCTCTQQLLIFLKFCDIVVMSPLAASTWQLQIYMSLLSVTTLTTASYVAMLEAVGAGCELGADQLMRVIFPRTSEICTCQALRGGPTTDARPPAPAAAASASEVGGGCQCLPASICAYLAISGGTFSCCCSCCCCCRCSLQASACAALKWPFCVPFPISHHFCASGGLCG
jgi:hypothetical protein